MSARPRSEMAGAAAAGGPPVPFRSFLIRARTSRSHSRWGSLGCASPPGQAVSLAAAVPLAGLAAGCYGAASALQAAEAGRLYAADPENSGLRALARRPLWLVGLVADVLGLVLHVLALTLGPASLIQPLQVTGLLLALPLARYLRPGRTRPPARSWRNYLDAEIIAALLLVAGLAMFLVGTRPRAATLSLGAVGIGVMLTAGYLVQLLATLAARRLRGRARSLLLGSAAGASFAVTSVLIDSLARERRLGGWSTLLDASSVALIVGAIGIGLGALSLSQRAFQSGPLAESLPAITVVDPFVAVVLGGALLGETPHLGPLNVLLAVLALGAVSFAVHALAHPRRPTRSRHARARSWPWRTGAHAETRTVAAGPVVAAAGIGACYGLLAAVVATLVDIRADTDDGRGARIVILLTCVPCAAVANVVGQRLRTHHRPTPT